MAAGEPTGVIWAAFLGNFAIALTKLAAALFTGASAMLAEAVHSFVDSGNQILMLWGVRQARRPADETHPFGHGRELFFWSFVVAILLFSIGAGVSIYEGIEKIRHPAPISAPWVNFIVLGFAAFFELYAFRKAWRAMAPRRRRGEGVFAYARRSKDAALFTVLFEDSAALLGIAIAAVALILALMIEAPWLDGVASLLIGCLLALAAVFLARETKSLLIGEAADRELMRAVRARIEAEPGVAGIASLRSMHLGPEEVLLTANLRLEPTLAAPEAEAMAARLRSALREVAPSAKHVYLGIGEPASPAA